MPSYQWNLFVMDGPAGGVDWSGADIDPATGDYYWGFGQRHATSHNDLNVVTPAGVHTQLASPPFVGDSSSQWRGSTEIALLDGYIYIMGGYLWSSNTPVPDSHQFMRYSIAAGTWELLTPLVENKNIVYHRMITVNGSIYLATGRVYNGVQHNGIYKFTPGGSWVRVTTYPTWTDLRDSVMHGLSYRKGKLYLNKVDSRNIYSWDIATGVWTALPVFPVAAQQLGTAWIGDSMHCLAFETHHRAYDLRTNTWSGQIPVNLNAMERGGRCMRSDPSRGYLIASRDRDLTSIQDFVARFDTVPADPDVVGWQVGSIRMGAFPLPPKTILEKEPTNSEYVRLRDDDGSVCAAVAGDLDLRMDVSHISLSFQEHLFNWGSYSHGFDLIQWTSSTSPGVRILTWDGNFVSAEVIIELSQDIYDRSRKVIRVTRDADNGIGNQVWTVYTGASMKGPWTQVGVGQAPVAVMRSAAGGPFLFSFGVPGGLGTTNSGSARVYAVKLFSNKEGTGKPVVDADFTQLRDAPEVNASGTFTDYAGELWEYQIVNFIDPATP